MTLIFITIALFFTGLLLLNIFEELGGGLMCISIIVLAVAIAVVISSRSSHIDEYYRIEQVKRNVEDYSNKEIDSLNEYIHKNKYYNKQFFYGDYIPDQIDTITFIKKEK